MRIINRCCGSLLLLGFLIAAGTFCCSQTLLSPGDKAKIDISVRQALASTGVPSASIAIVKNGQLAYANAYGNARLQPELAAKPDMRYSIGSISKQFTAAAILMLAEQGKLSLDDPVARFVPNLTRANEVTIRELLSQTSGYQDYWPQDYVMPGMLKPVITEQILDRWARIPLDFDPGTKWQYSNTNYVIAGVIAEKAAGMPLLRFLNERVFTPLHMTSVVNIDQQPLSQSDPGGYLRYALGPPRPAPKEGKGWLFAAGELAMSASDLARWDISLIDQKLLKPASYHEMETEVRLKNGLGTLYGLGLDVTNDEGHRRVSHTGEVSGFVANNVVFPDDRIAIVVLTNQDASSAARRIADDIRPLLFPSEDKDADSRLQLARNIFNGLQHGNIDRDLFTPNCNAYFTDQALRDFAESLGPLGSPVDFKQTSYLERGGMRFRGYTVKLGGKSVRVTTFEMPDGKLEQYLVIAVD
ncbi:MAG: beta-lactamase family protein [Acidobacteriaceae bacterium]|nr:beta-lactamase family protein [Acidobacteriaceae bacterium]